MKMENLRVVNYFPKLAFTPPNEKKCTVEPFNSVLLLKGKESGIGFYILSEASGNGSYE